MQAFVAPQALEGLVCPRCTLRTAAATAAAKAAAAPAQQVVPSSPVLGGEASGSSTCSSHGGARPGDTAQDPAACLTACAQHRTPASTSVSAIAPESESTESSSTPHHTAHSSMCTTREATLAAARAPARVPLPDLGDHELDEMLRILAQTDTHNSLHAEEVALDPGVSSLGGVKAPPQLQHEGSNQLEHGAAALARAPRKDRQPQQQGSFQVSPCPQIQEAQGHLVRVRRPAVQHTSVGRLPQVLVLQLQRSRWDTSCLTGPLK
eukprot:scaffold59705_cov17-Tisochrysis_lutea.AAC.1